MPSAVKSCTRPSSTSVATSPPALTPKRKFAPTTTACACTASTITSVTNRSGDQPATSRVKGSTRTPSTPASASSETRVAMLVRIGGACSGRSTEIGCGSKVTTTTGSPPRESATSRARCRTCW